jgi:hypothetical protein
VALVSSFDKMIAKNKALWLFGLAMTGNIIMNLYLATGESKPNIAPILSSFLSAEHDSTERISLQLVPVTRPPLDSIVQEWDVTGDASWLLNFAVVGFPKCGTSTLMLHLQDHPEVQIFSKERCDLSGNQQVTLIRDLYNKFPSGNYVKGIKCPQDLESSGMALPAYQRFFPKTNFIVGIRHPILWFESFYNFRIHNKIRMPPAEELVGLCGGRMHGVCTSRGNFHFFLRNLGKTNTSDPDESRYIGRLGRHRQALLRFQRVISSKRRVFLYEVSQLSDANETRSLAIREDLQQFLGLREPIAPFIWIKPGKNHTRKELNRIDNKKIDICDDKFAKLRSTLMEQSVNASKWIREYFVDAEDVVVSSKEHFSQVLLTAWERDPCLDRQQAKLK